jgi:hypothetical protein
VPHSVGDEQIILFVHLYGRIADAGHARGNSDREQHQYDTNMMQRLGAPQDERFGRHDAFRRIRSSFMGWRLT